MMVTNTYSPPLGGIPTCRSFYESKMGFFSVTNPVGKVLISVMDTFEVSIHEVGDLSPDLSQITVRNRRERTNFLLVFRGGPKDHYKSPLTDKHVGKIEGKYFISV
ncbi:hypothetical protein NPIL_434731 [Nephila pilipes]|uniref:Uncharacterized protein n=1 Tax=Nephila pilipes TaxID=299642 RepID=A0A8X6JTF5_NEPPI|nr:hypothetical protein NPIL_434731 [Nephila pilipes]